MKFKAQSVAVLMSLMCLFAFISPMVAYADGEGGTSLDDLSGQSTTTSSDSQNNSSGNSSEGSDEGNAIESYLRGYTPITGENMEQASTVASPIVNVIGTISGFLIMIVSAGIFLVTALDLCYIGLPFLRGILNPQYAVAPVGGGAAPMMGGMGMMGGRMGMMGGMGGMPGANPQGDQGLRRKWVSDEAVACVQLYAMSGNQTAQAAPMVGGVMGGVGMPGVGAPAQQAMPTKSVMWEYVKKRSFFMVVFALATVILMSSVFTDCGLNLALLLTKVINKFSGQVVNIEV